MTNFDKIMAGGPEVLAKLFVDSKIIFSEKTLESIGITYKASDKVREDMFKEHYALLTATVEE